jgi:hypothetical protein
MRRRSISTGENHPANGPVDRAYLFGTDYFDGTAEIEEARIVLPEMVPCAVTI